MTISSGDLWEQLGDIELEEFPHILNILFASYEELQEKDPENQEAAQFFTTLAMAINQTASCNANRR